MVETVLAYQNLPSEVTTQLQQLFRWLLWIVEAGLVSRLAWVGGYAGWEYFHPPPGPPAAPSAIVRTLAAWIFATVAWPIAAALLMNLAF
ncbi:hypothetical protein ACIHDR_46005 [Nocardia sp. NPDC052278]|uniref:hypothetical protein n=1 Tax=unclassified Nocardia TaxID=2637762 RepID=UPI0036CE5C8D